MNQRATYPALTHTQKKVHQGLRPKLLKGGGGYFAYWLTRSTSTVLRSKSSKKGSAASPSYAGCWPASSCITCQLIGYCHRELTGEVTMTVLPLYCMIWHDRPTSLPPPRQRNLSSSAGSTGSSMAALAMAEALRLDAMMMMTVVVVCSTPRPSVQAALERMFSSVQ